MATASDVIKRALLLIDQIAHSETLSGDQAVTALNALNQMLHGWELEGIRLQHSDVALADTLPYPDDHIRAITYNLAVEMAPEYGYEPAATVVRTADQGKQALSRAYSRPPLLRPDPFWHPYYNGNTE
jgi:hypothetical protein